MRFVMFYHSLVSDWNHGNAHFLRGVVRDLQRRGHRVVVYEPQGGWSRQNLVAEHGEAALELFRAAFPDLESRQYDSAAALDLDQALDGADVVMVHEWNEHDLVRRLSRHRIRGGRYRLLFHDTHHRAVTSPGAMSAYDLSGFDGVLAFGEVLRQLYLRRGWAARAWTWHEAADTTVFRPPSGEAPARDGDLVWIGNWGDEERTAEVHEMVIEPVRALRLAARFHGVRYPEAAVRELRAAGIEYGGWLPNHRVPAVFAGFGVTVHVPRRPYVEALRGIPTIRPFEALACGIPLVSACWHDDEGLFRGGRDYLEARDGAEMQRHLRAVLQDAELAAELARSGLETVRTRHTCAHRVDELLEIVAALDEAGRAEATA